MRLFVALPVAEHVQDHVQDEVAPWWSDDRVSWTRPGGWHVTLAFLGEVDQPVEEVTAVVTSACRQADVDEVSLATGEVTTLGRGALALQVHDTPDGAVTRLGADVQAALATADLPVHRRPVRPHLTLGRARRRRPVPRDLLAEVEVAPTSWVADHVEVVQSILGRGPATYAPVATAGLTDGAD